MHRCVNFAYMIRRLKNSRSCFLCIALTLHIVMQHGKYKNKRVKTILILLHVFKSYQIKLYFHNYVIEIMYV